MLESSRSFYKINMKKSIKFKAFNVSNTPSYIMNALPAFVLYFEDKLDLIFPFPSFTDGSLLSIPF